MSSQANSIDISTVAWRIHRNALKRIYLRVFAEEQALTTAHEPEYLEDDASLLHILASCDQEPIGYARCSADGRICYMAILPHFRASGIGKLMLAHILKEFMQRGVTSVSVISQDHCSEFYLQAGFSVAGDEQVIAGVRHRPLTKTIDYTDCPHFVSGVTYPHPFQCLGLSLIKKARRSVKILSPNLDPDVFDNADIASALTALARKSRHTYIQILVADTATMVKRTHQLATLAQRISSSISIRILKEHPSWRGDTCVLTDTCGVLYMPENAQHRGFYKPDSPAATQRYLQQFEELWNAATPDPQLQILSHF